MYAFINYVRGDMRLAYEINKMKHEAVRLITTNWLEVLAKCILSERPVSSLCSNYLHQQCRFLYPVVVLVYMCKFYPCSTSKTVM